MKQAQFFNHTKSDVSDETDAATPPESSHLYNLITGTRRRELHVGGDMEFASVPAQLWGESLW